MASIKKWAQFGCAEAVLAVMETLIDEDHNEDLFVGPGTAGLHVQLWSGERRCNIFGHGNSDALVLVIGGQNDFDHSTRESKDCAQRFEYAHNEFTKIAQDAIAWLHSGIAPLEQD